MINGTTVEVLNFYKIFVNYFAGSMLIFYIIAAIVIVWLAAKFRFPNIITLMMIGLFMLLMSGIPSQGSTLFYGLVILIIGGGIGLALSKIKKP